jgi:hypothetical protein
MVSVRLKRGVTAEFLKHFAEMLSPVSYQGQTRKVMVRVYCRSKGVSASRQHGARVRRRSACRRVKADTPASWSRAEWLFGGTTEELPALAQSYSRVVSSADLFSGNLN